jgi:ribonuclease HII
MSLKGAMPLFDRIDVPEVMDPAAEARIAASFNNRLAGIDEAGRGPWAGPVAVAAVILDADNIPAGLADSKALNEARREALYEQILACAHVGLAFASPRTIDALNIRAATLAAMAKATHALEVPPAFCLIDGRDVPPRLPAPGIAVVKGDARLQCIAAASIVAKVARDRLMKRMDLAWPEHGLARHKGYGTAAHAAALAASGVTPLHRRSFRPIAALLGSTE